MDEIGAGNAAQDAHADLPAGRAAMPAANRFWAIRDVTPCTGRPPSWAAKCLLDFSAGSVLLAQQCDRIARSSREVSLLGFHLRMRQPYREAVPLAPDSGPPGAATILTVLT